MSLYPPRTGSIPYAVEFGPDSYRTDWQREYDRYRDVDRARDDRGYDGYRDDRGRQDRYRDDRYDGYDRDDRYRDRDSYDREDRRYDRGYDRYDGYRDDDRKLFGRDGRDRDERGRGGRGRDPRGRDDRRPGRGPRDRAGGGAESGNAGMRTPLLLRGSLAVAVLLAVAASVVRAGAGAPDGNSQTTLVLGKGMTTPAIQTAAPSGGAAEQAVSAPQAQGAAQMQQGTALACQVKYAVTAKAGDRFTAVVTIANPGPNAIKGWALRWAYPASPQLSNGFNAVVTTDTTGALARPVDANRTIPAGGSTTIGFVGTLDAAAPTDPGTDPTQPAPSGFSINGVMCR